MLTDVIAQKDSKDYLVMKKESLDGMILQKNVMILLQDQITYLTFLLILQLMMITYSLDTTKILLDKEMLLMERKDQLGLECMMLLHHLLFSSLISKFHLKILDKEPQEIVISLLLWFHQQILEMENQLQKLSKLKLIIMPEFIPSDGKQMVKLEWFLLMIGFLDQEINHHLVQLLEETNSGELFLKNNGLKSIQIIWLLKLDGSLKFGKLLLQLLQEISCTVV